MIQPLRAAHRRAWLVLAIILPVVLVASLAARRPLQQPGTSEPPLPGSLQLLQPAAARWQRLALETSLYGDLNRPNDFFVVTKQSGRIIEPDLLLYWSGQPPQAGVLPDEARLLGAFVCGKPLRLPREMEPGSWLIAYSLARQQVADFAPLEKLP